ncbi:alpha/beta hydrolase [Streptosporangium fragile]|uniref:Alpha/beta hydrolase n=1 Tax=Streptosporangium fragile TaxID=46186 RepID=A0ABP6I992_9ACTN
MATFVLVHGSWAGGWMWEPVRLALEADGHRVLTPSLTGMAERHHLAAPDVGVATHVRDVARLLQYERLSDVILVGHSYGGMVITGVAAAVPDRIGRLVYVDAFLPDPGERAWDLLPWQKDAFETLRLPDRPWLVRPVEATVFFPELEADYDGGRLTPMPIRTHEEPLPAMGDWAAAASIPSTYLHCTGEPAYFDEVAERARTRGHEIVTIDAGHMVIVSHPHEVADLLRRVAVPTPA